MRKLFAVLGLLFALAGSAKAGSYQSVYVSTTNAYAYESFTGIMQLANSSATPTNYKIVLNGVTGVITSSGAVTSYGGFYGSAVGLTNISISTGEVSGTVQPNKGGTGLTTLTAHGLGLGEGTSSMVFLPAMAAGGIAIGAGTGVDPATGTLTGTSSEITVTNAAGSITLSAAGQSTTCVSGQFLDGATYNHGIATGGTCQSSLSAGGSGTSNRLSKFSGTTSIANSSISDDGTKAIIGTTSNQIHFDYSTTQDLSIGSTGDLCSITGNCIGISGYFQTTAGGMIFSNGSVQTVAYPGSSSGQFSTLVASAAYSVATGSVTFSFTPIAGGNTYPHHLKLVISGQARVTAGQAMVWFNGDQTAAKYFSADLFGDSAAASSGDSANGTQGYCPGARSTNGPVAGTDVDIAYDITVSSDAKNVTGFFNSAIHANPSARGEITRTNGSCSWMGNGSALSQIDFGGNPVAPGFTGSIWLFKDY
jgi:hypothetical protein